MIRQEMTAILSKAIKACGYDITTLPLSTPSEASHGDYYSPVALTLSKVSGKKPRYIAEEIRKNIGENPLIKKIDIAGPGFLNFWISDSHLNHVLLQIDQKYGSTDIHEGKKVIVEYSSPNIAKPFTIGHLRSTIIGDAIANLLEATGYKVYRDNHVGDWGTQFGKLMYAILTWGDKEKISTSERPVKELVDLYVKFHDEAEKNPELEDKGRAWFKKLEDGDQEAKKLWQFCIDASWKEFDAIYQKLGVKFTENHGRGYGESFFEDKMGAVIKELESKLQPAQMYRENNGAKLVFFPDEKYPPLMIIKKDGATLYSTRDLATDSFRLKTYGKDILIINEVGAEQSLYFNQLFETEQLLGWTIPGQRVHVKHGMYRFKEGKMSTRKGNVIWLEDVLQEAEKRAFYLIKSESTEASPTEIESHSTKHTESSKKHIFNLAEKMNICSIVGIGAIKWNDLKRSSHLDITFDWDEILKMDGNSGPYIQYTYVRCKAVLEKSKQNEDGKTILLDPKLITESSPEEKEILRKLIVFPEVVMDAATSFSPNQVCTYLFEVAQLYNLFYQKHNILKSNEEQKQLRLTLTKAVSHVLQNGLSLLGIHTVEKM